MCRLYSNLMRNLLECEHLISAREKKTIHTIESRLIAFFILFFILSLSFWERAKQVKTNCFGNELEGVVY